MTRRAAHQRLDALLGSRWVQTVTCYRITRFYLTVAFVVIVLLLMLT